MASLTGASVLRYAASVMTRLFWSCILLAALSGFHHSQAQIKDQPNGMERQLKAAYLYKFAGFVEWPDGAFSQADSPLVIGVIGADPLAEELQRVVAGRTSNGRSMQVRRLRRGESMAGIHILFIGSMEKAPLAETLALAHGYPLLTVTDSEDAYALGSMINFVVAEDKMRFEVALKPVGLSRLKISARMLAVAYRVAPG